MDKHGENLDGIADEMKQMVNEDQAMRKLCEDDAAAWDDSIDWKNTKRMKEIVAEIGWPSVSKVGSEGATNAWLLVQHADHDVSFQKRCLELMKAEVDGEVEKRDIAYLEDRIAINEEKPQVYGTQYFANAEGRLEPLPIDDPEGVEERRAEIGLETLVENQRRVEESHGRKGS